MEKYGIFGGTFNPPHIAHCIVAESVREQLDLDKIIFIPSGKPPLKEAIDARHRFEMAKLTFSNNPYFEVSEIEIQNPEVKSYTVDTLTKLNSFYKDENVKLFLIIGVDNLISLEKWKDPHKLFELSEVVVINRPDYSPADSKKEFSGKIKFVNVPYLEISSSKIRENISEGKSIRYMVTDKVQNYIKEHELYQ